MRSTPLVLVLLIGVQAVLNMGGGLAQSANHKVQEQTRANQRQTLAVAGDQHGELHRTSHHRTKRRHRVASHTPDPSIPAVEPKLFAKRQYRSSPRVVFSEVPPSHDALEAEGYDTEGGRGLRVRRKAGSHTMHRGEYSVCDSINTWVGNMTRATDIAGNEVTVLPNVTINNVVKKQFFYETTCRTPTHRARAGGRGGKQGSKSGNSGCLGIDSRHWNSYCTNTHIFVSALTIFKERTAWRFIRINAACVCVLSRKSWAGRLVH
ncbi:neurotrophin-7 [Syngnathus acus]|uniref:neurotrophin-7 n=1 Tax=Syngnathus acus TaxID=161584 RepID=UPI001885AFBC|nr:neurotrophin-7 [Syngnathus acus]